MLNEKHIDEYLRRFPQRLQDYLMEPNSNYDEFLKRIRTTYDEVDVYRAIYHKDHVDENDFLEPIEESIIRNGSEPKRKRIGHYGVSVNENLASMLKGLRDFPTKHGLCGIAHGKMKCEYGPADFDEAPHHNWFIFDGMNKTVSKEFVVEDLNQLNGGR